jgi:hypothetical protein
VERETFSSELRDVHERRPGDRDSFNDEFRGASDSLIEKDRPSMVGGRGRGAVVAMAVVLLLPLLIGGGIALWYWRVPIGSWLAGTEPAAEIEPEPAAKEQPVIAAPTPDLPPAEPAVEKVFGIRGVPDENAPLPTPEPVQPEPPVQPDPPAQPNPQPIPPVQPTAVGSKIEAVSTNVSGSVESTAVSIALDKLDQPLAACWEQAKAAATEPIELELSITITRDGTMQTYSVGGGNEGLNACVRAAVPSTGWPRPRAGVASVTRTWKLG